MNSKMKTLDRSQEKAFVYGFFDDSSREFLYVGQTLDPYYRHKFHLNGRLAKPELLSSSVRYIILRKTNALRVSVIESQIIKNLKLRGQCKLNRHLGGAWIRSPRPITNPIECSNGMVFIGKAQAARYFGCCSTTVGNVLKRGGEITSRSNQAFTIWLPGECPCEYSI